MKKFLFTAICCVALINSSTGNSIEIENTVSVETDAVVSSTSSDACRATCTISVNGIGLTATAGGIFTSCDNAAKKACEKVTALANALATEE